MAAWSVVIGTVLLVGVVVVVLVRQGSPGRLSEHHGPRVRRSNVVDGPADPGAETMHVPASDRPPAASAARGEPDIDRRNQGVNPSRPPAEGGRAEVDEDLARRHGPKHR